MQKLWHCQNWVDRYSCGYAQRDGNGWNGIGNFGIWNTQDTSPTSFGLEQWRERTGEPRAGLQIRTNSGWYLNIGKPLPSADAIQSTIRSEATFIRDSRYRFHLSASTSNKSADRFRGIARLTKNNEENEALRERVIDFDDRFRYGLLLR